jgi:hypothetical protein
MVTDPAPVERTGSGGTHPAPSTSPPAASVVQQNRTLAGIPDEQTVSLSKACADTHGGDAKTSDAVDQLEISCLLDTGICRNQQRGAVAVLGVDAFAAATATPSAACPAAWGRTGIRVLESASAIDEGKHENRIGGIKVLTAGKGGALGSISTAGSEGGQNRTLAGIPMV